MNFRAKNHVLNTYDSRSYKEITRELPDDDTKEDKNEGIKLFSKSKNVFKSRPVPKADLKEDSKGSPPDLLAHRKRTFNEEDFQSVAVSPQWVLNQEGVHYKGPDESRSKVITEM